MTKDLLRRLQKIKMLCTDVDGVLTDGGMYYTEEGDELKKFSTRDGMGLSLIRAAGLVPVIITSEQTRIVKKRAKKLRIEELHQGVKAKAMTLNAIRSKYSLRWDQIAYIGDDVNDLEVITLAGFSAVPADGMPKVKREAHYLCTAGGGEGCVREVCDLILSAQRLDRDILRLYRRSQR